MRRNSTAPPRGCRNHRWWCRHGIVGLLLLCLHLTAGMALAQGRPWLGIGGIDLNAAAATLLDASERRGILIRGVLPDSPAARAGLWPFDIILEIDSTAISGTRELADRLVANAAGRALELTIFRGGEQIYVPATPQRVDDPRRLRRRYLREAEKLVTAGEAALSAGDDAKAFEQISIAAQVGNARAQFLLAEFYRDGVNVDANPSAANLYFMLSALSGHAPAGVSLANAYSEGSGVPRDDALARHWLAVARNLGDPRAAQRLKRLEGGTSAGARPSASSTSQTASRSQTAKPATGRADRRQVRRVQEALLRLGYEPGVADGLMGRRTGAAITAYQRDSGLPVTGQPSAELEKRLRAALAGTTSPQATPSPTSSQAGPPPAESDASLLPALPPLSE